MQEFVSGLSSIPLLPCCMSVFQSLCQYHTILVTNFLLNFEIRKYESSSFVLFQDCFGYSMSFELFYTFLGWGFLFLEKIALKFY